MLLDLDDTIVAYDAASAGSWREVCEEFAQRVGTEAGALCAAVQAQAQWFWGDPERHRRGRLDMVAARRRIVSDVLAALGMPDAGLARAMAERRTELHEARIEPFPGALETLGALRQRGVRLALVTNGAAEAQTRKVDRFGLRPLFDCIVIEGVFGAGKPDPRVFRHALTELGALPAEAWMVGDNLTYDIAPARALGLYAVWHDVRGAGLPDSAPAVPDRIIRGLPELLQGGD
jgi:putative hydrolase of the HAD superfamily